MQDEQYFVYAAELLKLHPPHLTDQPIIARMKRIGIEPGKSFDASKVDPVVKQALKDAPAAAQNLMAWKVPTMARVVNYWSMNTDTMGVYGNYYLKRAIVAQLGLGANLPEDAIYPLNLADETGMPLDGASKYMIHFEKGAAPPVRRAHRQMEPTTRDESLGSTRDNRPVKWTGAPTPNTRRECLVLASKWRFTATQRFLPSRMKSGSVPS
jgi:hypothetical protein